MASLIAVAALVTAGVSALLAILSALASIRNRSVRFTFAALAFAIFATRSILIVADGAGWLTDPIAWDGWTVGLDALVVGAIYLAIVKG